MASLEILRAKQLKSLSYSQLSESSSEFAVTKARFEINNYLDEHSQVILKELTEVTLVPLMVIRRYCDYLGPLINTDSGTETLNAVVGSCFKFTYPHLRSESPKKLSDVFIVNFARELYRTFNLNVTTILRAGSRSRQRAWDCTEGSVAIWLKDNGIKAIQVGTVTTKWTRISKHNAGLIIAYQCIGSDFLLQPYTSDLKEQNKYSLCAKATHAFDSKNLIKPSITLRNQLKEIDLIDPGVYSIAQRFYELFSSAIKTEGEVSYVEVELAKALSCWYAAYKTHGVSTASSRFSDSISSSLLFALRLNIQAEDGSRWCCFNGSLTSWLEENAGKKMEISILEPLKGPPSKQGLLLSSLIFTRRDMAVWRIPMPGRETVNYWGDFAYE